MNEEKLVMMKVVLLIVDEFQKSRFPVREYGKFLGSDEEPYGEILIRIPPAIPIQLKPYLEKRIKELPINSDRRSIYHSVPTIENIELHFDIQRRGFLKALIYCIAKIEITDYVIISNVNNLDFKEYLDISDLWIECEYEWGMNVYSSYYVKADDYIERYRNEIEPVLNKAICDDVSS